MEIYSIWAAQHPAYSIVYVSFMNMLVDMNTFTKWSADGPWPYHSQPVELSNWLALRMKEVTPFVVEWEDGMSEGSYKEGRDRS